MSQFRISTQATRDIENIWKYVAQNNSKAADKLFDILRTTFPKLAKFPQMGIERPELAAFLRSFPVKSYLIFYRPIDQGIEIVRILHGSQDIEGIFQGVENTEDEK
ncbi:type II toxin-antitoxin system RelE/ParE family toxin [Trichormus variabilis]|uniref:Toxin n=1 Tax=Trichormus variabilis SAG 1403-4b TaxID=447716 RepID=A0A3S1CH45_ANAVA|nr:type II toxin-antitoxin system RelE/ParE family toxin [Trichormus variabilis]MBD2629816.1 type II toxin-antitoxin system RelE/ParE family toxin [Trichormus variabilis FACHB-164]RUS92383.1 plasmid stabilization protein [Trichormus variabilis SAG 1403-4b]